MNRHDPGVTDERVTGWGLGAAESLVLRDGPRASATDALRLAVTELVVRGAARIETVPAGWRGRRTESRIARTERLAAGAPPSVASVDRALDRLEGGPAPVRDLARTLVGTASADRWLRDVVAAGLVDDGLLVAERTKMLGILPRTCYVATVQGELERQRLAAHLTAVDALREPGLRDPVPVIAAAGASVLLAQEVWPLLSDVRRARRASADTARSDGGSGGDDGWDLPDGVDLDLGGLGDLDLGALDALDSAFDGIGADVSGGADGGGGDGGGGD